MFRKIFFSLIFILITYNVGWGYGIVDKTVARDTLSIPFYILDSLGNPVDDATGDSVFIVVVSPGGVEVSSDSMLFTDSRIIEFVWEDYGNAYVYMDNVNDLAGASTSEGVFAYLLLIDDASLGLQTPYMGTFQIIEVPLDSALDLGNFVVNGDITINDTTKSGKGIATYSGGVDSTLLLKALVVSNPAGDAVQFTSTGINGDGLQVTGNGSGAGFKANGGATGPGTYSVGYTGVTYEGITSGSYGLEICSNTNGVPALNILANGNVASAIYITGGSGGHDIMLAGGGDISDGTNHILKSNDPVVLDVSYDVAGLDGWNPITSGESLLVIANVVKISDDSLAAVNLEADYDGTGYDNIYASELDNADFVTPLATSASLVTAQDSLNVIAGIAENFTLKNGQKAITVYNAVADTIYLYNTVAGSPVARIVYYHPTGVAGQAPDSVKFINY